MKKSSKRSLTILSIGLFIILIIVLYPFYLVVANAFKSYSEITKDMLGFPTSLHWENFATAMKMMDFWNAFWNTLKVTVMSNVGLIIFGTMCGYWLIRKSNKLNKFLYYLLLGAMAIPFQSIMIPLVQVMKVTGLTGSHWGMSIGYWGLGCSTVIFLTYGAIKSIPYELEEAAIIDGCSQFRLFWKIIFPLLKTIVLTFTILNTFWFWNDYLYPQLCVGGVEANRTIQIAIRMFTGENYTRWDWFLPALVVAIIIPIIFFIICQRKIVEGMVSGAVKG